MTDPEAANAAERKRWNDEGWIATWLQREPVTHRAMPNLLDALALTPGERVLDIGCGGGAGTIDCARIVGATGQVIGVDISDALIQIAEQRAREAIIDNVTFLVGDAQTDTFPGGPFDVAASKFGVMFFDDPLAAFTNIRNHVRDGGRLAFACFQSADRNPWHVAGLLLTFAPPSPAPPPGRNQPGPFSLGDADATTSLLERAGFSNVHHTDFDLALRGPATLVYDESQLAGFGIPEPRRADAAAAVAEHLARFAAGADTYEFPLSMRTWTADAT